MPEKFDVDDTLDELALSVSARANKFENSRLQINEYHQDGSDLDSGVFCTNPPDDVNKPTANNQTTITDTMINNSNNTNRNFQRQFLSEHDNAKSKNIFDGFFGCIKPILHMWSTKNPIQSLTKDEYEIPFENITNLEWVGGGAQGCVFKGLLNGEQVAVKKVKSKEEANIKYLCRLDHPNLVRVKGVSFNCEKFFCIIMEFCPYGQLYSYLNRNQSNFLKPNKTLQWSKQVANAMYYLHDKKIIHRDLKSPNILISQNDQLKISDFGASKDFNEKSCIMSFAGTVSWMAPEIIRHEPCSEKVDVWSYGVVLWELLTCETPYKNMDTNSILFGVGTNKLRLQIPNKFPDGVKLLLQQCWSLKPRNRPTFQQVLKHLDIIQNTDILFKSDDKYFAEQNKWRQMINQNAHDDVMTTEHILTTEQDLIDKRNEELRQASDVRELYERKLERTNDLYFELSTILLQLDVREKEISRKEKLLNINATRKRAVRSLIKRELFRKTAKTKKTTTTTSEKPKGNLAKEGSDLFIQYEIKSNVDVASNENNFFASSTDTDLECPSEDNDHIENAKHLNVAKKQQQRYSPKYLKRNNSLRRSSRKNTKKSRKPEKHQQHQQQQPISLTSTDDELDVEDDDHVKRFSLDDVENRLKSNYSSLSSYYYNDRGWDRRNSTDDCENTSERPYSSHSLDEVLDDEIAVVTEIVDEITLKTDGLTINDDVFAKKSES